MPFFVKTIVFTYNNGYTYYMRKILPYVANFDEVSCQQAVWAMILEKITGAVQTKVDMDALCNAQQGKWTWPFAAMKNLSDDGYQVEVRGEFNIAAFAENPERYHREFNGIKNTQIATMKSDMDKVVEDAKEVLPYILDGRIIHTLEKPTLNSITNWLDRGYLINHWLNSRALADRPGYAGHHVALYAVTDEYFVFHNPGGYNKDGQPLNHNKGQIVGHQKLLDCSVQPGTGLADISIAIRKPSF